MIKKIIYGLFFLLALSLIAGGGYYFWQKKSVSCFDGIKNSDEEDVDCGGSCISCAFKDLHPLLLKPAEVFDLGNKTIVLFEVENPNTRLGIINLPYTIKLLGENDKEIAVINRSTFIYPGATKYIIESFSDVEYDDIRRTGLALDYSKDSWEEGMEVPTVELVATRSSRENGEHVFRGDVVNNNAFPLKDVAVYVLLNSKLGIRLAAIKSLIGEIEPFGQKQFKIIIPINNQLDQSDIGTNVGVEARR